MNDDDGDEGTWPDFYAQVSDLIRFRLIWIRKQIYGQ